MTTLVGKQSNFIDAVKELIELDFDAIEAYQTAINRLDNVLYKKKFEEFKKDHENHVIALSNQLKEIEVSPPEGPSMGKQWIAMGKVVLANLIGDKTILSAMNSNEEDTNVAYARMYDRNDKWTEIEEILRQGLDDERRHKSWLEETMASD